MKKLFIFKILFLISFHNCSYSQYLALDQSFGDNGSMSFSSVYNSFFTKLLIDTNGKLIFSYGSNKIVRLNANGTLDTTFGTNGTLTTPIIPDNGDNIEMFLINDKIVYFYNIGSNYKLVCLNPDGTNDLTFGNNGEVVFDGLSTKTIETDDLNNIYVLSYTVASQTITKYLLNGTIDNSYGINGVLQLNFNLTENSLLKIKKVNINELFISRADYPIDYMYKLNSFGILDSSFGDNGVLLLSSNGGSIIKFLTSGSFLKTSGGYFDSSISKYNNNGQIDLTFGESGSRTINGRNLAKPEIYNDKIYCSQLYHNIGPGGGSSYGNIQTLSLNADTTPTSMSLVDPLNRYPTDIRFVDDKLLVYGYRYNNPTNFVSKYILTPLSVDENENEPKITFENPVDNEIKIYSTQIINSISLFGLDGKLLKISNGTNMDVSDISKGVYLAKLNFRNGSIVTKKIIKK